MNVKRGLFRLWLLTSVLYAGGVFAFDATDIKAAFEKQARYDAIVSKLNPPPGLKLDRQEETAQSKSDHHFDPTTAKPAEEPEQSSGEANPFLKFVRVPKATGECPKAEPWCNDPIVKDAPKRTLKWDDIPSESPWVLVWRTFAKAIGLPLFLLGLSMSIAWVAKGFRA